MKIILRTFIEHHELTVFAKLHFSYLLQRPELCALMANQEMDRNIDRLYYVAIFSIRILRSLQNSISYTTVYYESLNYVLVTHQETVLKHRHRLYYVAFYRIMILRSKLHTYNSLPPGPSECDEFQ